MPVVDWQIERAKGQSCRKSDMFSWGMRLLQPTEPRHLQFATQNQKRERERGRETLLAMASNLIAMASNLIAKTSNLIAVASTL